MSDLAERYLEQHVEVRLKPRTRQGVRGALRNHILPALGRMPVAAVERRHVIDLQQSMSAYPVAANRALKVLSHMYRLPGPPLLMVRLGIAGLKLPPIGIPKA